MKPDIIIKSFNRPYYLHRCIESIYRNVQNFGKIKVLDDGTPAKYLEKIKSLYPEIHILLSDNASSKSLKIEKGEKVDGYEIPSKLWISTVENSTTYTLVTEDDVWFTSNIDLESIANEMKEYNVHLTKLGWQGNTKYLYNFNEYNLGKNLISQYSNNLFLPNKKLIEMLLHNKYYLYSIFCRLGITNNKTIKEYYNFISIPMGLYRKDFWLYTWRDSKGRAKELDLIKNAVSWVNKHKKDRNLLSRNKIEVLKTTYISSAVGDYRSHKSKFDMLAFNKILNEKWYEDQLDALENFPNDFHQNYLASFMNESNNPSLNVDNYNEWCNEFKNQFRSAGAIVD